MGQMVLAIPRAVLTALGDFQGYTLDVERYLPVLLRPENQFFIPRASAEHDPSYKQLIPYVVLRYRDTVVSYVRGKQSGETRLVAKRSIGLGGHVEPQDNTLFSQGGSYYEGVQREVAEEVTLDSPYVEHVVALINDDTTEVGQVHLGVVHVWDLAEPRVSKRESEITQLAFASLDELRAAGDALESWSQFALQVLADPRTPRYAERGA